MSAAVRPTAAAAAVVLALAALLSACRAPSVAGAGYSFTDGIDPVTGELDAGLFFLAYQKDPRRQFIRVQAALSARDALNEYLRQTSSAIFAVPPDLADGAVWGDGLLD